MEANREEKEEYVVGWRGFLTYQERDRRTQDMVLESESCHIC